MPSSVDVENGGSGVCDASTRTSFRRRCQSFQEPRKFPPVMPLLARTGNGNVQMPWVLKRSYTDNGRLVIHEVRVRHHDFFRVSRADGRLTLQLMHMDEPSPSPFLDSTTVAEFENNEKKDREEKIVRGSLLRPAPLPKREKHGLIAPPQDQETNKGKESFRELKMMEQRLFRLPMSFSSSALSSLATASEKTDAVDSLLRHGNCRRLSDVSRVSSLPSITSSMPELLLLGKGGTGGGSGGGGWLIDNISDSNSPLQVPIRPCT